MHQLRAREELEEARRLASGLRDQSMAMAVLGRTRPGTVLVNDRHNPSSLFIGAPEGSIVWTYLAGRPDDSGFLHDLNSWLFGEEGIGRDISFSFLVCDDISWESSLAEILAPRAVIPDRRLYYICTQAPESWRETIPDGYSIRPIDRELLDSSLDIPESIAQWFNHNFGSKRGFLEHGFGAVAIHDGRIVGRCLADSVDGDRADIGPEIDEAHRQKGLAYCTTCLTLEQGFARGLKKIGWHCLVINTPSVRTADKAGFQLQYEYPAYVVQFDPEKHKNLADMIGDEIIGQATDAFGDGDIPEAHRLFERALAFYSPVDPTAWLLAARAAAGRGEANAAFDWLAQAVSRGWVPGAEASDYPELTGLQSDSRWLEIAQ
ncbi:GNAT family N-acetyltransferase [Candidatus Bipolaricaulota bacterium]